MRHDFSPEVKRKLAQRAGYRCSVSGCGKATIGPGTDADAAISDGVAAHITAASPGGPRFDPSLTEEQRRSIDNGIWTCSRHGREIDDDKPAYSVAALRGQKRLREELARRENRGVEQAEDRTVSLIELPYADNPYSLFGLVHGQPYTYPTTAAMREVLRTSQHAPEVLGIAADVIIGAWADHPDVAGILSTLLSNNIDSWQPVPAVLDKLEALCEATIGDDDWSRVALTEPLAFALSAKGKVDIHTRVLKRLVESPQWRDQDARRVRTYYGTTGVQIAAIMRHWQDQYRNGLLRANDVGRLMDILISSGPELKERRVYGQLVELLAEQGRILADCGQLLLGRQVLDLVEALRAPQQR